MQVSVIEFQKRGLPHAHIVFRPAVMPFGTESTTAPTDAPQPWADHFTCARKPTPDVLAEYGLLTVLPSGGYVISSHLRAMGYRELQRTCPNAQFYINRRAPSAREVCKEMKQLVCGDRACMDGYASKSPTTGHRTSGPMEHGPHPNDDNRPANWCKKTAQGFCKSCFPRPCGITRRVENGFIELKRRVGGQIRPGWTAGDEFIVPYNPWMLFKYRTHINVEIAAKVSVIAYLYKYLFKGGDRARYEVRKTADDVEIVDEIADWKQGMYTSASEASWLTASYDKFNSTPCVDILDVHVIDPHSIEQASGSSEFEKYVFRPPEVDAYAAAHFNVMELTATEFRRLFVATSSPPTDVKKKCKEEFGQHCRVCPATYMRKYPQAKFHMRDANNPRPIWFRDMHLHGGGYAYYYPCLPADRHIARLQRVYKVGSELWYFRMFVMNKKIPIVTPADMVDPLRPVRELTLEKTFQSVARMLHLVPHDQEAEIAMTEAVMTHTTPFGLFSLFVVLTMNGYPTEKVLHAPEHQIIRDAMSIEFTGTTQEKQQKFLKELKKHFESNGKNLSDYGITEPTACDMSELTQHRAYWEEQHFMMQNYLRDNNLFPEQQRVADRVKSLVLQHANEGSATFANDAACAPHNDLQPPFPMLFLDGPAGTGKTTTITHLLYDLRLNHRRVCVASATTALAAQLYHQGETVHALAKLNVTKTNDEVIQSSLKDGDQRFEFLSQADFAVIDEAPSLMRANWEAFVQLLIRVNFKGVLLLAGDYRQIAPVVRGGQRSDIVNASPRRSLLWAHVEKHKLSTVRRIPDDLEYAQHVTAIGNDTHIKAAPTDGYDTVELPSGASLVDMSIIPEEQRFTGMQPNYHIRPFVDI